LARYSTGKTLLGNLLIKRWFWRESIQKILWNFTFNDLRGLSYCGYNLVVIDDIPFTSEKIHLAHNVKVHLEKLTRTDNYRIVLILIFNGDPGNLELPIPSDLNILRFQEMDLDLIQKCIDLNARNLNTTVQSMDEFLKDINYEQSGCKTVLRKLMLTLGREETND
jgi:hypothetical protein